MRMLTALALFPAALLCGQSFEVASIKTAPVDSREGRDFRVLPGGRLHITNMPLKQIVLEAFGIKQYQLSGGPAWLNSDTFDIDAKAEGDPSRSQMMVMLQHLLAERCGLQVHRETHEGNVYILTVVKGGPKLKPSTATDSYVRLYRNTPRELPGVNYTIGAQKVTMAQFADGLVDMHLQRPVFDRTGISGEYDLKLNYAIADDPEAPSIFTAIQEQLGLKLETAKGPIETLIIDRVEKPTAN
jgi:uncharacterized protein (TIGR03435 family)